MKFSTQQAFLKERNSDCILSINKLFSVLGVSILKPTIWIYNLSHPAIYTDHEQENFEGLSVFVTKSTTFVAKLA